jgi:hypothetical protein
MTLIDMPLTQVPHPSDSTAAPSIANIALNPVEDDSLPLDGLFRIRALL